MTLLGRELGWTDDRLAEVQDADYLHDIGKIAVSDRVLLKAGPLSSEEWELMRQHPGISAEIVRPLFSEELTLAVRHHHERFDGDGYPDGLAGAAIPLVARAMCLVDAYDAMSCGRPYRVGLTRRQCLDEMRRCSGAQFDPELVTTFVRALERLEGRRRRGVAVAEQAAALVDPDRHALLRSRADEARPEYAEMVGALRKLRDASPPVHSITTFALQGDTCITVLDTGETPEDFSHVGDPWLPHDELAAVLSGDSLDANVVNADEFGVWVTCVAPLRAGDGDVAAAVTVDMPAVESGPSQRFHRDMSQDLSVMLQAASVRWSRAELEAITDSLTGLYNHRYLQVRLDEEIERARLEDEALAVLFIDLDEFKVFNDSRGHKAGDEVPRRGARLVTARIVEHLELVEVDEQHRQRLVLQARALDLLVQPDLKVPVVVKAREAVGDRFQLGPAPAHRCRLQHHREVLRHIAVEPLRRAGLHGRHVDRDRRRDVTVAGPQGGDTRHPDAELVGVHDVGVQAVSGQHRGELVVRKPRIPDVGEVLRRLPRVEHRDARVALKGERGDGVHRGAGVAELAQGADHLGVLRPGLVGA